MKKMSRMAPVWSTYKIHSSKSNIVLQNVKYFERIPKNGQFPAICPLNCTFHHENESQRTLKVKNAKMMFGFFNQGLDSCFASQFRAFSEQLVR